MPYVVLGLRCLIGVVFLTSSLSKVAGRGRLARFAVSLRVLGVVPRRHVRPVASAVVAAECVVCILLALPAAGLALVGFALATCLLVAFTLAILGALRRGVHAPCRCFGPSTRPLGQGHVWRNACLTLAAVTGVAALALSPAAAASARPAGAAVALLTGLCAGGLVALLDTLRELFRPTSPTPPSSSAPAAAYGPSGPYEGSGTRAGPRRP
ncbi:MauE/DoxX family redox-associated membrane protein [Streptomyces olivaceoviridis]